MHLSKFWIWNTGQLIILRINNRSRMAMMKRWVSRFRKKWDEIIKNNVGLRESWKDLISRESSPHLSHAWLLTFRRNFSLGDDQIFNSIRTNHFLSSWPIFLVFVLVAKSYFERKEKLLLRQDLSLLVELCSSIKI